MFPLVRVTLSLLRVASHASLFLEAQRVLLRVLRPSRPNVVARLESRLLRHVRSRVQHLWVHDHHGHVVHVLEAISPSISTPTQVAVLLHGHSMSAAFWYRNMDHLTSLGFRVLAVDLLGWGRSERVRFKGVTPEDSVSFFADSLHSTLCTLISPNASITLIGHSFGAYIAFELTRSLSSPSTLIQQQEEQKHDQLLSIDKLILVSPAAAVRPVPFSRALYFSLPPQAIVRRGGLLGFLLFSAKYPRRESYIRDRLRDYTYHLAMQTPPSGETAVRPIIKFLGWRRAECARPLVELIDKGDDDNVMMISSEAEAEKRSANVVLDRQTKRASSSSSSPSSPSPSPLPLPLPSSSSLKQLSTLVMCGDSDSSMPVQGVLELYSKMKARGYDVALSMFKDCNHCPQLEMPQAFYDTVADFVHGRGQRRQPQRRQCQRQHYHNSKTPATPSKILDAQYREETVATTTTNS